MPGTNKFLVPDIKGKRFWKYTVAISLPLRDLLVNKTVMVLE